MIDLSNIQFWYEKEEVDAFLLERNETIEELLQTLNERVPCGGGASSVGQEFGARSRIALPSGRCHLHEERTDLPRNEHRGRARRDQSRSVWIRVIPLDNSRGAMRAVKYVSPHGKRRKGRCFHPLRLPMR